MASFFRPLLGASDQADEDDERVSGDPTESPSSSSAEMPAVLARSPSVARLLSIPRRFLHLRRFLFVFFLLLVGVVGFAKWKFEGIGEDSLSVAEEPKRYVGAHFIFCNGLANQMYRYASLYAIGKAIGREPYVDSSLPCTTSILPELKAAMPTFFDGLHLIKTPRSAYTKVDFATKYCCKHDNVSKLLKIGPSVKYLKLNTALLQSYKFFHERKSELRKVFAFSPLLKEYVAVFKDQLIGNDTTSHKFCVHTRLGDFKNHPYLLPSKHSFTNPAIEFVGKKLKKSFSNISLVILGTDKPFVEKIRVPKGMFFRIHTPRDLSRTEELHFASSTCDSFLITASGSTFAWWMAYLMPDEAQERVFYNYLASKDKKFGKDAYDFDTFPTEWHRLRRFNATRIDYEDRWHRDIKDDKNSVLLHRGYKV